MNWKQALWGVWIVPPALAADRVSKAWAVTALTKPGVWIPSVLGVRYTRNTGAAFSLFSGVSGLVTAVTAVLIAAVAVFLLADRRMPKAARIGLWLVFAGGLGNLFDRLVYGYVIDFIEVLFVRFAVFNVADICVCCGAFLAAAAYLFCTDAQKEHGK